MIFELDLSTMEMIEKIEETFGLEYMFMTLAEDRNHVDPEGFAKKVIQLLEDKNV